MRGFVREVLSLFAWVLVVFALKLVHAPVTQALTRHVATSTGAAVLAFALIAGAAWFGGRMLAQSIGKRTRTSVLGPLDRAMGFGFGALKGLILASLAFLLVVLVTDTAAGGPKQRPLLADQGADLSVAQRDQRLCRGRDRQAAQRTGDVRR